MTDRLEVRRGDFLLTEIDLAWLPETPEKKNWLTIADYADPGRDGEARLGTHAGGGSRDPDSRVGPNSQQSGQILLSPLGL